VPEVAAAAFMVIAPPIARGGGETLLFLRHISGVLMKCVRGLFAGQKNPLHVYDPSRSIFLPLALL